MDYWNELTSVVLDVEWIGVRDGLKIDINFYWPQTAKLSILISIWSVFGIL